MRNYLEDWLSEEESVVVPPPARSMSRQRRTKQGEEAEEGNSAGQTSGKQIENDGARMVWTEQREAGGGTAGEKSSGPLAAERAALPMALAERQTKQAAVCGDGEGRAGGTAGSGRRTGAGGSAGFARLVAAGGDGGTFGPGGAAGCAAV